MLARPSVSKTAFALSLAKNMAMIGEHRLVSSVLNGKDNIRDYSVPDVDLQKVRRGWLNDEEWATHAGCFKSHESNIIVDDESNLNQSSEQRLEE